ncbi:hypothetical protein NE237_000798 [Protea cynaroides]|uniref:Uncharacterized protein n=1 Tax=Protea cynaroides TaxID=273540 RepID=A0A9Q0KS43_9MAGN|nr:hypothetical protein NE237_000798 [Protea cynaroides]
MEEQILDYALVPSGLVLLVGYHIWLLHRIRYQPMKTAVGINVFSRRLWAESLMEEMPINGVLAVQTLRNNIMAGTLLATTAMTLNSIIVLMIANFSSKPLVIVFGNKSELSLWIKIFSVMFCFLLAFLFTVQSVRYYSHAGILIQVPVKKCKQVGVYVVKALTKGSYFWAMGLRALYFSFPLFMWFFGPIPMFMCCLFLVFTLYFLDTLDGGTATGDVPQNGDMEQYWSYVI